MPRSMHRKIVARRARHDRVDDRPERPSWRTSIALGVAIFVAYSINLHAKQVQDTEAATLLPIAMIRGHGPVLTHFKDLVTDPDGRLSWHVEDHVSGIVSRYPIAPALVALPLVAPQVFVIDRFQPGWDTRPEAHRIASMTAKNAAAVIVTLACVVLFHLLHRLGLGRVAVVTTLAVGLGSNYWAVASQAPWQHGPAALALSLVMLLLATGQVSRLRVAVAGLLTGLLVALRLLDVVFAATIGLWVARHYPRRLIWFLPLPALIGLALFDYNLRTFGSLSGGLARLEALHPEQHRVASTWSGNILGGALGTLFSPSRGLFVYTPWVAVSLAFVPNAVRTFGGRSLIVWLLTALVPFGLLLSKYAVWWAGHSFGPRYWIDALPVFGVLMAVGLDWAWSNARLALWPFGVTIAWSVAVQAIGAMCYPSSWNDDPNVDHHHERLWDWRDTELSRCLAEGPHERLRRFIGAILRRGRPSTEGRPLTKPTEPASKEVSLPQLLETSRTFLFSEFGGGGDDDFGDQYRTAR